MTRSLSRLFFMGVLVACVQVYSYAQSIANYSTARSTGATYSSISTTGNAFNSWRNTTSFTQDDNRSDFTNIGFDFWYDGTRYTQFCVSTNGYIDFSSSTANGGPVANAFGYDNTAFTNSGGATAPAITPFYDDLTAQGGTNALGNSIKYTLSGSAPNRVLTIEWINMAVYGNTSPSLNFQVKLYETTGIIEMYYGTMNTGSFTFSYSMGINGPTLSATPTAAQLKMLQAVNGTTLNNTVQNNLSAMPAANSKYAFTPPVPTAVSGTLTFSGVSQSVITLNFPNWATNEVGYVVYNSTDGINYSFVTQTAANATSAVITGLLPGTLYYWKVYAVTEGCLSSPLSGSQATTAGGSKVSNANGNWSNANIWTPVGVPTSADNVTITNGTTVLIDVNATCNRLTIGSGAAAATLRYTGATARTFTVNNSMTVNALGVFDINTTSNVTHTLIAKGNITNNGTINMATDANSLCNTQFINNGNQTLSGTGATNKFNNIQLNMGTTSSNTLNITATTFTAPANFLTLTNGVFKLSTTSAVNLTPFTAAFTIPLSAGITVNSASATVNTTAGMTLYGTISVVNGVMNLGNAADQDVLSSGGTISVSGGTLTIAGKLYSQGINNLCYFNLSGGTTILPNVGSTNTTIAPFQMTGAGSQFSMSGGTLLIPREGGTGAQNLGFVNTGATIGSVTGGTLQIGNASSPAGQTIDINTNYSIGNLLVNSANVLAELNTNTLNVIQNITINTGSLTANNLDMSLGGNWVNNGGTFIPGTASVTCNSASAQSITKPGGETFNHLVFNGAGTKTFGSNITTNGNFVINSGSPVDISASNYTLTVKGNFSNSGTLNTRSGLVFLNGTTNQAIGGTSTTNFYNLTLNNTAGAILNNAENIIGTLTLNNGTFNTNSKAFTLISTATGTGRIAQITGTGDITGNVTVQRYAPGGTTGWALLGTPITSALTLADWDDNIPISCPTCPDGSAGGFLSIYTYDETKPGLYDDAASYIPLSGITDPIIPGKGYWVYLGNGQYTTTAITLDVTGTVRKFAYSLPLSYTNNGSSLNDGWNLICNPYPSPIRWSLLKGATANIDNAVYAYNADLNGGTGGYSTYINGISSPAVGAGGIGDTIPIGQGFYVHSTGATALSAQESNKVGGNPTFLRQSNVVQAATNSNPMIRLYVDGLGFHDETVLYTEAGASNNFDFGYDAYKLRGQDPYATSIALSYDTTDFQVNGVAPITGNFSMYLKTITGYAGAYTISAANVASFPSGACINLYDRFTGVTTDLRTSTYAYNLADTTTVARFILNISLQPLQVNTTAQMPSCTVAASGQITAAGVSSGPWNFTWRDPSGNTIRTQTNRTTADTLRNIAVGGTYEVDVNTVGMCDFNTSTVTITPPNLPVAQFSCADTTYLSTGAMVAFSNNSSGSVSDAWNFGDGMGTSTANSPTYYYNNSGTYVVSLVETSSSGCTDTATKTVVVINNIVTGITGLGNDPSLSLRTLDNNQYMLVQNFTQSTTEQVKLMDINGRLVMDFGTVSGTNVSLPLDLSSLKPGIYMLNLISSTDKKVVKLPVK